MENWEECIHIIRTKGLNNSALQFQVQRLHLVILENKEEQKIKI